MKNVFWQRKLKNSLKLGALETLVIARSEEIISISFGNL